MKDYNTNNLASMLEARDVLDLHIWLWRIGNPLPTWVADKVRAAAAENPDVLRGISENTCINLVGDVPAGKLLYDHIRLLRANKRSKK